MFSFCLFFSNIIVIYICWSKYIPVLNVIVKCYCDMKSKYVYIDRGKNTLGSILRTDLVSVVSYLYLNSFSCFSMLRAKIPNVYPAPKP